MFQTVAHAYEIGRSKAVFYGAVVVRRHKIFMRAAMSSAELFVNVSRTMFGR